MPLYEYKCHKCGKVFEVIEKFSDPPMQTHADCGGEVERLLSAPAFHLKGTGWYATDYAKKNTSPAASKSDETKSDSKSDSKPAEKPAETKTESKPSSSDSKSDSK
jgi:putative FmdB family regulatory protein